MSPESQLMSPPAVLLVDDNRANLIALSAVLKPLGAELVEASGGVEALAQVALRDFAVALVDVQMPGMDGFEVAKRIRATERGRELPIMFLTAIHRDDRFVRKGYAAGAADYITKPFDIEIVRARVRAFVDLFVQRESVRRTQVALRTEERDDAVKRLVAFERIASAALGTSDLSAFLRELCSVFIDSASGADSVCIWTRKGNHLHPGACFGSNEEVHERLSIEVGDGFVGTIAATGEPIELSEASASPFVRSASVVERGTNALYGVPLLLGGEVLGVAYIGSKTASSFPEHEKRLFRALAQRAAWAIAQQMERARVLDLERRARLEAEEATRLREEFLATVSHELRSPLNAILGFAVLARAKAPAELERALAAIERNARAQARIVDDVLDVSRIVAGKLRLVVGEIAAAQVIERALDGVRPAADAKRIDLVVTVDPEASLRADAQRLQQIIWNLVSNAIKFSPAGGRVELSARQEGDAIVIVVADEGEGIAPEFLPHVFEAFRQADSSTARRHGGLGLGLSIVHQLVLAHGGRISASSDGPGHGAAFRVTLPVRCGAAAAASEPQEAGPAHANDGVRLDGLHVLVVDDDDDARTLVADVLRDRGAEVSGATSASEGLAKVVRTRPDVVVSDIAMPGGDGFGLIRDIRALAPDRGGRTPAVALTAHARRSDGKRAMTAGFQGYLAKPMDADKLVSTIASVCAPPTRPEAR